MDDLGNRSNVNVRDGNDVTYSVDNLTNRYNSVGDANLAYDQSGNLTTDKDGYQYQYDYENRLVKILNDSNTAVAEYAYDALGRRIKKEDSLTGETTVYYHNNNWQVLCDYNDSDVFQRWYGYGNYIDEVLWLSEYSFYSPYVVEYYVHDHLYSPVALVAFNGAVHERYEYDAYGNATIHTAAGVDGIWLTDDDVISQSSAQNNPYLFTGRTVDTLDNGNLKIQYNRNRYYNQKTARWLTQDPLGYGDGLNLYEYVQSHPLFLLDPAGMGVYSEGTTVPDPPAPDPGAGPYASLSPPSLSDWLKHGAWSSVAWATRRFLPDASWHMRHYLDNTGVTLEVRVENMIRQSPGAKKHYYEELNDAMEWVEGNVGCKRTKPFVGTWTRGENEQATSKNWFFAVAGYSACGSGWGTNTSEVTSRCTYQLDFTFHFSDKYNWDTGKGVQIGIVPIADASLGKLHLEGIAKEFDMTGKTRIGVCWEKGQRFDETGALSGGGRRRCRR